jgi:hypothetical protein
MEWTIRRQDRPCEPGEDGARLSISTTGNGILLCTVRRADATLGRVSAAA